MWPRTMTSPADCLFLRASITCSGGTMKRPWAFFNPPAVCTQEPRPSSDPSFQLLRMVAQVIPHEGLHEVVAMIIARLHAQAERLTRLGGGRGEYLRQQLLGQKLIRRPLIDEDRPRKRPARDQLAGVVFAPALGILPQIIRERLPAPGGLHRRRN